MTFLPKNVYVDKSHDMDNECNKTYRTIQMKPIDINSCTHIKFNVENNDKNSKLEAGDHVRISKYKIIFAKGYTQSCSEEGFLIKEV